MDPIKDFAQMTAYLQSLSGRKKVVVVCPNDPHTEYAILRALEEGIAEFILVADCKFLSRAEEIKNNYPQYVEILVTSSPDEAAALAVQLIRQNKADILMKGLINTDNLLRAVLNKEKGILPKGEVLTHVTVARVPVYPKLLVFSDAAVIPRPTLEQFKAIIRYTCKVAHSCGVEEPRIAMLHCSEKVNEKFPHTLDYVELKECALRGEFGRVQLDGPMDVKTACDIHSGDIKGLSSPVVGNADVLIFPNIESGNTFYKTVTLFTKADIAGMLCGPTCPVVVTSRSDSGISKYYSLALACLSESHKSQIPVYHEDICH